MLKFFKPKNQYSQNAKAAYGLALSHARNPQYYAQFGVPDSFDGRFDLLLVHIFALIYVADNAAFNQALFDATFADMDQTLREMGIGDMGVPKHMRKMMKGFNGRMHAYDKALKEGDLAPALLRNLYGTVDTPDISLANAMAAHLSAMIEHLKPQDVISAQFTFMDLPHNA